MGERATTKQTQFFENGEELDELTKWLTSLLPRFAANINRSLLALANCINALAQGNTRKNAKYRDSKLTHLLKSSLEGQCKLIIIANINPSDDMFEDSHNTLKYANRAKCMKIDPKVVRLRERDMAWPEREKVRRRRGRREMCVHVCVVCLTEIPLTTIIAEHEEAVQPAEQGERAPEEAGRGTTAYAKRQLPRTPQQRPRRAREPQEASCC